MSLLFPSRALQREMLWYHLCKCTGYSVISDFMHLSPKLTKERNFISYVIWANLTELFLV